MFVSKPKSANATALVSLLLANSVPLVGVLFFGWKVFDVMVLFWLENVVVGVINVIRMLTLLFLRKAYEAIFMIPFFCFHYGMFTYIHGLFVFVLFGSLREQGGYIQEALYPLLKDPSLLLAATGLFLSHFTSYLFNFLGNGEYKRVTMPELMGAPYKRVVVLHLTILFGGFLTMATNQAVWALVLLIVLKTGIDLKAHMFERERLAKVKATDPDEEQGPGAQE